MKRNERFGFVILILAIVIVVASAITMTRSRGQENKHGQTAETRQQAAARVKKEIFENGDPVVDLAAPRTLETDSTAARRRQNRSSRFDITDKNVPADQTGNFEINENSFEILFGGPLSNLRNQPVFPFGKSTDVVVGEIRKSDAFLSNHRNMVYSEFVVEVKEFLFRREGGYGSAGKDLTVVRLGGKVRLPSGRLLHYGMEGSPLPKVGGRYLLFLDYDKNFESAYIVTAYEIDGGVVAPFDGRRLTGMYIRQYKSLEQFNGMKEGNFLKSVKEAMIQNNPHGGKEAGKQ